MIRLQKSTMIPSKKFLTVISFFLLVIADSYGQDLLNYSNSLKYANYLFQDKQYSLSAIEYERVSFLQPQDTLAKLRIVQSYSFMQDYISAENRLEKLFPIKLSDYPEDFAIEYFRILFHKHQFDYASIYLTENKTIQPSKKNEYLFGTLLMQYKWAEAKTFADDYHLSNSKPPKFDDLYNIANQGINIKYKKPYSAALFSALIPGSGKVYTKHWKDGIYSFIFVSAFSLLTYRSAVNNGVNFNSVFYGAIAFSLYSSNIYGSYRSAERYNQKINRKTTLEIESILFNE